jgi:RNA polymerase sigma factor (sigma-70 family)
VRLEGKKYDLMEDEQLLIALAGGDKRAFDNLYERYSKPLYYYFYRLLWKDAEKSQDFVQDFFTKLIHKPELFDTNRSFKTWMYSVASNMCKNEYKKQEIRKPTSHVYSEDIPVKSDSTNALEITHQQLFKTRYEEEAKNLDHKHREVFEMRHFDGLALKEISLILEVNEGTIKSRLFYATKYLANALKEYAY